MRPVSTRIPEEDEELLSELEAELGADRAEVLRRLIRDGLSEWRTERALDRLWNREITLRRAAELADLSYVELLALAEREGVDIGYTVEDVDRDLGRI